MLNFTASHIHHQILLLFTFEIFNKMRLQVAKRGSKKSTDAALSPKPLFTVELSDNASVDELKKAIAVQNKKLYPDRQRLTFGDDKKAVLEPNTSLSKYGVKDNDVVYVKDLGPQIGWQTVFYIEYLGPIIFHYIVYKFPSIFYGQSFVHSDIQW